MKFLERDNMDLKQELKNAQIINVEQRKNIENLTFEIKNLEHICNRQQNEIIELTKNENVNPPDNSKSWYEQVLDEEYYNTSNSEHSNSEISDHDSINLSLDSISSNEDIDKYTDYKGQDYLLAESDCGEILENHFYNTNFRIRRFENEHFLPTSDPIKVKLKPKNFNTICKFYTNNICRNGNNCPFLHPYQPENSRPPNTNFNRSTSNTNQRTSPHQNRQNNPMRKPNFNPQYFPHQQYSNWVQSQTPKRKYIPTLRNFPNSPDRNQTLYPAENQIREYRSYGKNSWNPDKNETCYYHLRGICRYGSGCHFFHPILKTTYPDRSQSFQH